MLNSPADSAKTNVLPVLRSNVTPQEEWTGESPGHSPATAAPRQQLESEPWPSRTTSQGAHGQFRARLGLGSTPTSRPHGVARGASRPQHPLLDEDQFPPRPTNLLHGGHMGSTGGRAIAGATQRVRATEKYQKQTTSRNPHLGPETLRTGNRSPTAGGESRYRKHGNGRSRPQFRSVCSRFAIFSTEVIHSVIHRA